MYLETYLFDQTNTQTVIYGQKGIDITWNNDQKVKLVKLLMTDIR